MIRSRSLVLALAFTWGCGGEGRAPNSPSTTSSANGVGTVSALAGGPGGGITAPSPSPSTPPIPGVPGIPGLPSPSPSPSPAACPLGLGTLQSTCGRTTPLLLPVVEAAIDQLVREQPSVFNLLDSPIPGVYRVLDPDAYYAGLVRILTAQGLCAEFDGVTLQVKNANTFSESYDVLTGDALVRRGPGSFRSSCTPAAFPVDPAEYIHHIRVGFYGFRCPDGRDPRNGLGELPVGCVGFVTATAKKADNVDVDARLVGPDITWIHRDGHEQILVEEYPDVAFNKVLTGIRSGNFQLCAVVKGVEGCLDGSVVP